METSGHHQQNKQGQKSGSNVYSCPMHPDITRDQPGKCPKCGMELVKKDKQEDHKKMVWQDQEKKLWIYFTIAILGLWLILSPLTFEYNSLPLMYSDIISGILLIILGFLSFNPFRLWAPWLACFVGIWLLLAPLVFWAPEAVTYMTDTVIGILIIALAVLIPGMPGMMYMMMSMPPGPETPPGWSYNPSSWLQRSIIIALGWIGFFGSRYLAAYQLGYIHGVWDPFFDEGTRQVLTSSVSRSFPISDAGFGTLAYTIELLMGYMGGPNRWRTMPWMVTFFGILVIPLGAVSIVLVMLQPVGVGAWCSICLLTAIAMLLMIPLTVDEVIAMIRFLIKKNKEGKSFWHTFWMGDTIEGGEKDTRSPSFISSLRKTFPAMTWGMRLPWNLLLSTAIGIWIMFMPYTFGLRSGVADNLHITGALVVTFSVIAMAEVVRYVRFTNILLGAWIVAAAFILQGNSSITIWLSVIAGIVVILSSLPKGKIKEDYGDYNRYIV